jgi:hypothetical protein
MKDAMIQARSMMWVAKPLIGVALATTLAGCIELTAPERPIEINLNIAITQEVVVRLAQDVRELRETNPGAF